jgi:hypothetical protein
VVVVSRAVVDVLAAVVGTVVEPVPDVWGDDFGE